ncbi:MAG TPA: TadE/TadG family type IV pilus assembly protein [Streptosporangiaceae bacterium]
MGQEQAGAGRLRHWCRGLTALSRRVRARARTDRGASAVELALLTPALLLASFMIISFAMWFDARHAALAAAQEGDLVAREEAGNPALSGTWVSDARSNAVGFYHGLDTSALTHISASASGPSGPDGDVSVTVSGNLNWLWSMTVSETISGPEECFHTVKSGGKQCP